MLRKGQAIMKTDNSKENGSFSMKRRQASLVLLGLFSAATAGVVNAQGATRAQVKMERDEFLKTHHYDAFADNWVLKPEFEAPANVKSRAEVKAERDEFFKNNRYDPTTERWVALDKPRDTSKLTREQVRAETKEFVRTHRWDGEAQKWVEQAPPKKK
jgi:hypothetical protein